MEADAEVALARHSRAQRGIEYPVKVVFETLHLFATASSGDLRWLHSCPGLSRVHEERRRQPGCIERGKAMVAAASCESRPFGRDESSRRGRVRGHCVRGPSPSLWSTPRHGLFRRVALRLQNSVGAHACLAAASRIPVPVLVRVRVPRLFLPRALPFLANNARLS